MCILYPPKVVATACYVLAQRIFDGPNSSSLDARISAAAPSASLPTPPSHKPPSPDASRYAIEYFTFDKEEISSVSGTNSCRICVDLILIVLQRHWAFFWSSTLPKMCKRLFRIFLPSLRYVPCDTFDLRCMVNSQVLPPTLSTKPHLYNTLSQSAPPTLATDTTLDAPGWTPNSSHGGDTPSGSPPHAKRSSRSEKRRLDLSWILWDDPYHHPMTHVFPINIDVLIVYANQSPRRMLVGSSVSTNGPFGTKPVARSWDAGPLASSIQFLISAGDHDSRFIRPVSSNIASDKVLRTPAEEPKSMKWESVYRTDSNALQRTIILSLPVRLWAGRCRYASFNLWDSNREHVMCQWFWYLHKQAVSQYFLRCRRMRQDCINLVTYLRSWTAAWNTHSSNRPEG